MTRHLLAAALAVLSAGPASANPNCLELRRVWSFKPLDTKTLIVEDDLHQKFKLDLMGYCPALPFKLVLGFKVIGGAGLTCIAKGDVVISHDIGIPYLCPIANIQSYTPAMQKADEGAAKNAPPAPPGN